eukprot:4832274-Pleurochrysis_carterae.AAC.2
MRHSQKALRKFGRSSVMLLSVQVAATPQSESEASSGHEQLGRSSSSMRSNTSSTGTHHGVRRVRPRNAHVELPSTAMI